MAQETPQQTQERRTRQKQKEQAQNKAVEAVTITTDTELPKDQQPSGQDKLNQLTLKKAINFVAVNIAVIDQVLKTLGLPSSQDLEALQSQGEQAVSNFIEEQVCPGLDILTEALQTRNEINEQLDRLGTSYMLTTQAIDRLSNYITGQIDSITLIKDIRAAANAAASLVPSPPGVPGPVVSLLNSSKDIIDLLLFTALGQPKLARVKATVDNGLMFLSMSSQALQRLLTPLKVLDLLLTKCGQTVEPLPKSIQDLERLNQPSQQAPSYKGFILDIEEVPFSNTVTRRRAVAKNSQGIILVETPLSFTTLDQVLLDQVKFIIDSQNLKPF